MKKNFTLIFLLLSICFTLLQACIKYPPPPPPREEQKYLYPQIEQTESSINIGDSTNDNNRFGQSITRNDIYPGHPEYCVFVRIQQSDKYLQEGKKQFSAYLLNRQLQYLFYAWYASEDARYMRDSIRRCSFKLDKHYHAMTYLSRMIRNLQNSIVINMRDKEYKDMGELYLAEYRNTFPRDLN